MVTQASATKTNEVLSRVDLVSCSLERNRQMCKKDCCWDTIYATGLHNAYQKKPTNFHLTDTYPT